VQNTDAPPPPLHASNAPPNASTALASEPRDRGDDLVGDRHQLIADLGDLTLPVMWMLRQRAVKAFEPLGIRPVKALILGMIAQGIASPKDLGDLLQSAPSATSTMIGDLEDRGWLERRPDPADRRRVLLSLTAEGQRTMEAMGSSWHASSVQGAEHLDTDDLRHLVRILRQLLETR